ncbi:MAG: acyltransferase family protein [Deltaproteobacteria bacterium]|nr:acyltransferase family protein [Deltaproteobacteria bacterium]
MKTAINSPIPTSSINRLIFLDNLRYLFVIGVVIQHATMAYMPSTWWPVADEPSLLVSFLTGFFDGFLMPSLFFIAGFFAIPSMINKSVTQFIKGKFRRLGIPWLACTLFIGPILPLIYHYTRNNMTLTVSYGHTWLTLMKNALSFDIGLLPPMSQVMENDLFYQRYMWFISLLMAFFLIFSLVYVLRKKWFKPVDASLNMVGPSILSTIKTMVTVGLLTFFGSTLLIGIMFALSSGVSNPESWFTLGNVIQFRVSRIFLHAAYFILGILTYKNRWLESGKLPGHHRTWALSFLIVFLAYYSSFFLMVNGGDSGTEKLYGLLHWFCLNFFTITALGLFMSMGVRYLNKPNRFNGFMTSHSYNLYLAHYLFVIVFQLLLLMISDIPSLLKFGFVSLLSICCGLLVSRYMIKPYPIKTLTVIVGMFLFMIIFIR